MALKGALTEPHTACKSFNRSSELEQTWSAFVASHVMSMSPQALNNNEKLFPIFDSHLSDTKYGGNYAPSSEKFEGWLSNSKAYYTAARPWVSVAAHSVLNRC